MQILFRCELLSDCIFEISVNNIGALLELTDSCLNRFFDFKKVTEKKSTGNFSRGFFISTVHDQ